MSQSAEADIFTEEIHGCHVRCSAVVRLLDMAEPQGSDDATMRRLEAVAEAVAEATAEDLNMAERLRLAAMHLPKDTDVTSEEMRLVMAIEKEVDAAFGEDSRLYGRAVALHCVRDVLGTR